VAGTSL